MIERIVIIDSVDPLTFYGVNNANLQLVKNLFPKLRISARGSVIRVIGEGIVPVVAESVRGAVLVNDKGGNPIIRSSDAGENDAFLQKHMLHSLACAIRLSSFS